MQAEWIMTLHVEVAAPLRVGRVPEGELMIIPITGGTFAGPKLHGRVLPGGADWNTRGSQEESHALARYWIQTDDGAVLCVRNEGTLRPDDDAEGLRTTPTFQCDLDGPYAFLMRGIYAGTLKGAGANAVDIGIYRIG
ncbi:MAG TPA: DUF3237 domain-containing protein [Candidatus Limiplasma sp.]|nr:DUF3237 domain-containing protein [Candidatus Limiplasma sp.]HRX08619.1 DUF3237 domain-containing protein [Candidatus Limiplasma sp.]